MLWTDQEERFLERNRSFMTIKELAFALRRSEKSIEYKSLRMRLLLEPRYSSIESNDFERSKCALRIKKHRENKNKEKQTW